MPQKKKLPLGDVNPTTNSDGVTKSSVGQSNSPGVNDSNGVYIVSESNFSNGPLDQYIAKGKVNGFSTEQSIFPTPFVNDLAIKYLPEVSITGTALQGTVDALSAKLHQFILVVNEYDNKVDKRIQPLKDELAILTGEVQSKIEDVKHSSEKTTEFIRSNADFLTNAIAVDGKIQVLESRSLSLESRLTILESNKNISWNKTTTIVSIIVAVLSLCVACSCGVAGIALYFAPK